MLFVDIAKQAGQVELAPDLVAWEGTGALQDLLDPLFMVVTQTHQDSRDHRPPSRETLLEFQGANLAETIGLPAEDFQGSYPKASVKVLHMQGPIPLTGAFAGFAGYVGDHVGSDVKLNLPRVEPSEMAASIALFTMVLSRAPGEVEMAYAQVHYRDDGTLLPYDIGVFVAKSEEDAEFANYWMNALKNSALMIFSWENNSPFDRERRQVPIRTKDGPVDLDVTYLLPTET